MMTGEYESTLCGVAATVKASSHSENKIDSVLHEARKYGFASVCINPTYVRLVASSLRGTAVKVCAVVGFPLGATLTDVKAFEARRAVEEGATEIDMVLPVGHSTEG